MLTRDKYIELESRILDERFALTTGEHEARRRFEDMVLATFDCLVAAGQHTPPYMLAPGNCPDPTNERDRAVLTPLLLERWAAWRAEYPQLLARNPRLELYDMMHAIGETRMFVSWPNGSEARIQDWIDSGNIDPVPFLDHREIVTDAFYQRLRELRRICGGWLYWDQRAGRIVFALETEWQRVRAARGQLPSEIDLGHA
jgi:hypothetical protein